MAGSRQQAALAQSSRREAKWRNRVCFDWLTDWLAVTWINEWIKDGGFGSLEWTPSNPPCVSCVCEFANWRCAPVRSIVSFRNLLFAIFHKYEKQKNIIIFYSFITNISRCEWEMDAWNERHAAKQWIFIFLQLEPIIMACRCVTMRVNGNVIRIIIIIMAKHGVRISNTTRLSCLRKGPYI